MKRKKLEQDVIESMRRKMQVGMGYKNETISTMLKWRRITNVSDIKDNLCVIPRSGSKVFITFHTHTHKIGFSAYLLLHILLLISFLLFLFLVHAMFCLCCSFFPSKNAIQCFCVVFILNFTKIDSLASSQSK